MARINMIDGKPIRAEGGGVILHLFQCSVGGASSNFFLCKDTRWGRF